MNNEYRFNEITKVEENHDNNFKYKIVIIGTKHRSKNLDITKEELQQIKSILSIK